MLSIARTTRNYFTRVCKHQHRLHCIEKVNYNSMIDLKEDFSRPVENDTEGDEWMSNLKTNGTFLKF